MMPVRLLYAGFVVLGAITMVASPAAAQSDGHSRKLPVDFVNDRIYATAVTTTGDTLRMLTDTGGGRVLVLTKSAVERIDLPVTDSVRMRGGWVPTGPVPEFRADASIPPTRAQRTFIAPPIRSALLGYDDGRLGQNWFAGRVWTLDYGAEDVVLHSSTEGLSFDSAHAVPLGFNTDSTGRRVSHHPRIAARVDGERHSFLFDTGATTILTDSARAEMGGSRRRGASYIIGPIFDHWRAEHPKWPVVEGARIPRGTQPLIRVPRVAVAGHSVGPVWFERRPKQAFQRLLSNSGEEPPVGALGGSLLKYFRVTIDYRGARAYFERLD